MECELPVLVRFPSVCMITGVTSDLGKDYALGFARRLHEDSIFVLMAPSVDSLQEVKKDLIENAGKKAELVLTVEFDQQRITTTIAEHLYNYVLQPRLGDIIGDREFLNYILIHNAGTISGHSVKREIDLERIRKYYDSNLIGLIAFNAICTEKLFPKTKNRFIINTSSLSAFKPFDLPLYSTGQVARDTFFKILAAEKPDIRVLNYAPGPASTEIPDNFYGNAAGANVRPLLEGGLNEIISGSLRSPSSVRCSCQIC